MQFCILLTNKMDIECNFTCFGLALFNWRTLHTSAFPKGSSNEHDYERSITNITFAFTHFSLSACHDKSLCIATNYLRKNKKKQALPSVGDPAPPAEAMFRLIGLCGIQWTRLHPPPTGFLFFLAAAFQTPEGNLPPEPFLKFLSCAF